MLCMAVFLCAIMIRSSCSPFIQKKIVVYDFAHDDDISIYSFEDKVPVHIWDGQCEIDFAEICEEIRDMYDES